MQKRITQLEDRIRAITEALARRDVLGMRQGALRTAIREATGDRGAPFRLRYSRSEIRVVRMVEVRALRDRLDRLAKQLRELEDELGEKNWTTELIG